ADPAVLQRGADEPEQLPRLAQGARLRLLRFRAAQSAARSRAQRDGASAGPAAVRVLGRGVAPVALLSAGFSEKTLWLRRGRRRGLLLVRRSRLRRRRARRGLRHVLIEHRRIERRDLVV